MEEYWALGGEAWEELEANSTIDAQVRIVPPHVFAYTMASSLEVKNIM